MTAEAAPAARPGQPSRGEIVAGWKLLKLRKDGSIGSLFCNARRKLPVGEWMPAEPHPRKTLAFRPFWHVMSERRAPHLAERGRVWCRVEGRIHEVMRRPASQGGVWYLCSEVRIVEVCHGDGR